MKHFLLVYLFVFFGLNTVNAQEFSIHGNFGARLDGIIYLPTSTSPSFLPLIGVHLGIEGGNSEWQAGIRASVSSFIIFIDRLSLDLYGRYTLSNNTSFYFGIGSSWLITFGPVQPNPNRLSVISQDWHALLGIELSSGFFVELAPGFATTYQPAPSSPGNTVSYTGFGLTLAAGWNWKF
jgi:hypothetical protein